MRSIFFGTKTHILLAWPYLSPPSARDLGAVVTKGRFGQPGGPPCWSLRVRVDCYIFVTTDATAFTIDRTGDNLPGHRVPWRYVRKAGEQELRGPEEIEVMWGLQVNGFAITNG